MVNDRTIEETKQARFVNQEHAALAMADNGDDGDSQLAATGALEVGLAATIRERGQRERTLEALEVAADLLHSESSSCADRDDTLEEKSRRNCRDEARHGRFQESATAKSIESRCRHMRIGPDAFTDLQELHACVLLGFAWKDFVEASLKVQTADSEESFVQLAMDSDIVDARRSHLICHASEGFFLPVQDEILPVFDDSGRVPGGWIGTSGQLLAELAALSPVLDIALRPLRGAVRRGGGFDVSEDALARLRKCTSFLQNQAPKSFNASFQDQETRLRNSVLHTWFVLFEGARLSQETGSALILHVPPHRRLA